jgi:phage-related minor tail protein
VQQPEQGVKGSVLRLPAKDEQKQAAAAAAAAVAQLAAMLEGLSQAVSQLSHCTLLLPLPLL